MLTYKDSDGLVRIEGCDEGNMEEMIHRCVDRLYEYEKLGLTPDGVRRALRELRLLKKETKAEESGKKRIRWDQLKKKEKAPAVAGTTAGAGTRI